MKSMNLNLGKMKKISSDGKSTTFQHPEGHEIRVAHSALSAIHRKQIEKLPIHKYAEGTESAGSEQIDQKTNPLPITIEPMSQSEALQNEKEMTQQPQKIQGEVKPSSVEPIIHESQPIQKQVPIKTLDQKIMDNEADLKQQYQILHGSDMKYEQALREKAIDPNHYYANRSTGGKISDVISSVLGGIGSAMSHQPNLAYSAINDQINRDIDAQKNDQSNTMNLWKMHHDALKDNIAATLLTRSNMLADAKVKMDEMTGNLPGPMASQRIALESDKINQERSMIRQQLAYLKQTGTPGQSIDGSNVNYNRMNALQKIGIMPQPDVNEATKEASELEEMRSVRSDFNNSFHELNNKVAAGMFTPADRDSALWTIAGKLQHASAGRFNLEDAKKQMDAMFPKAGDLDSTRIDKLNRSNALFDSLEAKTPTLNRYQLKNNIQNTSNLHINPLEGKTATGPNGQRLINQNGKWIPYNE